MISGLVSRQTKALVNKVPMLGDLPIIGAFFRSVDYKQEDTELVIVVTPRLVRPIARGVSAAAGGQAGGERHCVQRLGLLPDGSDERAADAGFFTVSDMKTHAREWVGLQSGNRFLFCSRAMAWPRSWVRPSAIWGC